MSAAATYINIPSDVKDEHYRYKMEKMVLKVEGRGNGIKTVVPNMANVAEHLKVPPTCTNILLKLTTTRSN
jgi:translation initiation factor 5